MRTTEVPFPETILDLSTPASTRSSDALANQSDVEEVLSNSWNQQPSEVTAIIDPVPHTYVEHASTIDEVPFDVDNNYVNNVEFPLTTCDSLQNSNVNNVNCIWDDINEFFDTMYIIFPIISYDDLTSRLILEPNWVSAPELNSLLLSVKLLNASGRYRMESQNQADVLNLIHELETSRLYYEFAEPATLDAVVCSLALFTAYNVLEKHNRAFLYLDEAFSLFDMVPALDQEGLARRMRIEQVLYNTEAATLAIYASKNRKRRARRPSTILEQDFATRYEDNSLVESDKVAKHLLNRLTQIHLAEDAEGLTKVNIDSQTDIETLFGTAVRQHRYSRIQAADVVLTRQWQLSSKLATNRHPRSGLQRFSSSTIDALGVAAMSWMCLLKEGELRIVGLGKLAGLAQNIHLLAGPTECRYVLGGIAGAVIREDHEKRFALRLADIIMPVISSVPPLIDSQRNGKFGYTTTDASTTSQSNEPIEEEHFHVRYTDWNLQSDLQSSSQATDGNQSNDDDDELYIGPWID